MRPALFLPVLALALVSAPACEEAPDPEAAPEAPPVPAGEPTAHARFWNNVEALCGSAFAGRVTEQQAIEDEFGEDLVMHVRECRDDEIRIPFHVGDDRSRTWILTRADEGLRLKHDHRHEDGTEDEVTQYGGDTEDPGTANRQDFHADAFTAELLPEAATNVWTLEITPGETFAYQLVRHGTERRIRFEFDLTDPVPAPPPPWGYENRPPT